MTEEDKASTLRLDKWLWAARFYKTRSQAAAAVKSGKVDVESKNAKASLQISIGAKVEIRKGPYRFLLTVTGLKDRRGNADAAKLLFEESPESIRAREEVSNRIRADRAMMPSGFTSGGRPTKKQRRELMALKEAYVNKPDPNE